MKHQVYFSIAIRLIFLFAIAMAASFLPEHLRAFFGDVKLKAPNDIGPDNCFDWGTRHYWWFALMVCLFILSGANFIISIIAILKKHYPKLFSQ